MKKLSILVAALLMAALVCTQVTGVRDEQYQPPRKFWRLDFQHTGLHYIRSGGVAVSYTTYRVTNNTGTDRLFAPIFRVETETKQLTYARPSPGLAQAIRQKHGKKFEDLNQITGILKDKETKLGVAIFHRLDPNADHVKVFVKGLTNAYRYQDEDNRKGYQRQEYLVHWFRPGDTQDRPDDRVDTVFDGWVWRSPAIGTTTPVNE
ncbi:MAG: hypothetical protein AMS16_01400 [Planctomycetes bacterium DG_58]|nr:MAG: hypothetical protein AMS16_01400 [Planctomycetes bacterium DG_58]KPL03292.1 MAG: hypothetical protein AMK75_01675 [Planctomycetes bacterium SM23_65]